MSEFISVMRINLTERRFYHERWKISAVAFGHWPLTACIRHLTAAVPNSVRDAIESPPILPAVKSVLPLCLIILSTLLSCPQILYSHLLCPIQPWGMLERQPIRT